MSAAHHRQVWLRLELLSARNTGTKPGRKAGRETCSQAQGKHQGIGLVSVLTLTHQQFRMLREESRRVNEAQDGRGALGLAAEVATTYVKCFMMN